MTKRVIALFLVCILAIPILIVPVSATTSDLTEYESAALGWLADLYYLIKNNVGAGITSVNGNLLTLIRNIQSYYNGLKSALETLDTNVSGYFDTLDANLTSYFDNVVVNIGDVVDGLNDIYSLLVSDIYGKISEISTDVGHIYETLVNSFLEIFQNIEYKIDSLISGGSQNQTDSEDFKTDVDDADTKLDEAGDIIDSATLPTIDEDFDNNVGTIITNGSKYLAILKGLFRADMFVGQVLLMSFMLSTVSYVFFGKRG